MQCPRQQLYPAALAPSRLTVGEAVTVSMSSKELGEGGTAALRLVEGGHPGRRSWTWSPGCHRPGEGVPRC